MIFPYICHPDGELAQLARALAWHARGHRFDSGILHNCKSAPVAGLCFRKSIAEWYAGVRCWLMSNLVCKHIVQVFL